MASSTTFPATITTQYDSSSLPVEDWYSAEASLVLNPSTTMTHTGPLPALTVTPINPVNGAKFKPGSTVAFTVQVTHYTSLVQGATVAVFVDGVQVCSGTTNASGKASCSFKATQVSQTYVWYATASLRGYTPGRSGDSMFKPT